MRGGGRLWRWSLARAMDQFGEDAVEMVSVWRVAREVESSNEPQADKNEAAKQRQRLEALERLRQEEAQHAKQRMEEERRDMEDELQRLADADKQLLDGDLARLTALIQSVSSTRQLPEGVEKSSSQEAESAVEKEIRSLLDQGAAQSAPDIAQLLRDKHVQERDEKRAQLSSAHEAEQAQSKQDRAKEQER